MRAMAGNSVTIERYAELRAEIEAGRLRDDVLARAGLDVDAWMAAQRAWLDAMGAEIARGRFELTNRYTQVFLERQRALKSADAVARANTAPRRDVEAPSAAPATPTASPIAP